MTKETQLSKFKEFLDFCGIEFHQEEEEIAKIFIECSENDAYSNHYTTFQFYEEKLISISCKSVPCNKNSYNKIIIFPKKIKTKGEATC